MGDVASAPNPGVAFSAALFEELVRSGVTDVCVCPGSRSAPLAVAAAREPGIRVWSHVDERSAGFFALGLAKAARRPVALVCTSGTAAANFLPAVVEAHYGRVPLVVLTADRPAELREWDAGQTIDQVRLYGSHVRWYAEAPVPEASDGLLRHARALASRVCAEAQGTMPGPVHLNLPFREPLDPSPVSGALPPVPGELATRGRGDQTYTRVRRAPLAPPPDAVAELVERVRAGARGVIACGPCDDPDLAFAVAELARVLRWPLLADPTSQLRCGPHVDGAPVIAASDLFLRAGGFTERHAPDVVLRFGAPPTSKAFRLWLERQRPEQLIVVDAGHGYPDPSHLASEILRADGPALCDAIARRLDRVPLDDAWLRSFQAAEARALHALDAWIEGDEALLTPRLVRELATGLPDGALLLAANSMAVRDLDAFLPVSSRALRVLCHRGANGIDGLVSSAAGAVAAGEGPVVLFTGDLAFVHDAGGLLASHRHGLPLVVVVANDAGGGIFSYLPIAEHGESVAFEELFRVPHRLDLGDVARGYGAGYARAESWTHFRAAFKEGLAAPGASVIEVPIDRDANVEQHRALAQAVLAAVGTGE